MKKFVVPFIILSFFFACKKQTPNTKISGAIFGTSYSIIYNSKINYQKQFDSLFYVINKSVSTYQLNSDISKLNRNENHTVDSHFITVFDASKIIYNKTNGVFDPTIGTIVNAFGFGPEKKLAELDSIKIDSLMQFVGLEKVSRTNNIINKPNGAFLDFNAIAKGYAVDVIADFLENKKVFNYLVEIGGEIRTNGNNVEKNSKWTVGIDKPNFNGTQAILKTITLNKSAMATSGTYRKFKVDENGNRYAHIINTKTGHPSKTNILSVSVLANDCMTADAYATAFQAMQIKEIKEILKTQTQLQVFLIFEDDSNQIKTIALNGFPIK